MENPFEKINSSIDEIRNELSDIKKILVANEHKESKFYSVKEAASKLKVAAITIYRGIEAGEIPAKQIGTRLMVLGSFVDKV